MSKEKSFKWLTEINMTWYLSFAGDLGHGVDLRTTDGHELLLRFKQLSLFKGKKKKQNFPFL